MWKDNQLNYWPAILRKASRYPGKYLLGLGLMKVSFSYVTPHTAGGDGRFVDWIRLVDSHLVSDSGERVPTGTSIIVALNDITWISEEGD